MQVHSIRFSSNILDFHIHTNQALTYWTKIFPKKFFCKGYSPTSKYYTHRSYTKLLNNFLLLACNSSVDKDLENRGRKSAYIFKEKAEK